MSCPTCGAPAEEGQLVCLECGSRVALGYHRPPNWRVPVAIVATVLILALAATAVALKRIGDESDREVGKTPIKVKGSGAQSGDGAAKKPAAKKPTAKKPAAKKPTAKKPAATRERSSPAAATGTELVRRGELYEWPRELRAFTVVLLSAEDRPSAESFARSASEGAPAKIGVIRADDFESLPDGFFVVFAGQYPDRAAADRAADRLGQRFSGSFPQLVER